MGGCGSIDGFMSNNEISNKLEVRVTPEDLWFVVIPPPLCRFMGGWLGQWMGSCQISKNWINWDIIEIIQFCLKVYDLWWHPTYRWVYVKIYFHQFQRTWYHSKARESLITNIVFIKKWFKISEILINVCTHLLSWTHSPWHLPVFPNHVIITW